MNRPADPGSQLRHAFCSPIQPLRIGILLPSGGALARWALAVAESLDEEPAFECTWVRGEGLDDPGVSLPPVLRMLMERLGGNAADRSAKVPLPDRFDVVSARPSSGSRLSDEAQQDLRAYDFDVLVWLGDWPLQGNCSALARLGVWTLAFGREAGPRVRPAYWRELAAGEPLSEIRLLRHIERFDVAQVIAADLIATVASWRFWEAAHRPRALAPPLLRYSLLDAAIDENRFSARLPEPGPVSDTTRGPSWLEQIRFLSARVGQSVLVRLRGNPAGGREDWITAVRVKPGSGHETPYRVVPSPRGVQLADPFVLAHQGRHWLFMEEIPSYTEHARLVCVELTAGGPVGDPIIVLERPYHLSYPAVFVHEGAQYMIPESGAARSVQLFEARDFPRAWHLAATLCHGAPMVDTSPIFHEGTWYFFTTLSETRIETFLFTSDQLDGPWQYHPANPICAGTLGSRGAGHLFRRGGKLVRPTQDCSVRYGYQIILQEVLVMSPTEYEERVLEVIPPRWREGLLSAHTINQNEMFEVTDGSIVVESLP